MEAFECDEKAWSAGHAAGSALGRHAVSMAETVRVDVRPEPPSLWSGALYNGMKAGNCAGREAGAGGGGVFGVARRSEAGL